MSNNLIINKRIKNFNKKIEVDGDKSLSIRWILFSSLASGVSKSKNLLISEDVLAAIKIIKRLGIKVFLNKETWGQVCMGGPRGHENTSS